MIQSPLLPEAHLFVCANRRPVGDPLGPGCGAHGDQVYTTLKEIVQRERRTVSTWITKTACLGLCPKQGATVASYSPKHANGRIFIDVTAADVDQLLGT